MFRRILAAFAACVIFPSGAGCRTADPLPAPRPMIRTHPEWPKPSQADSATIESIVKAFYSAISAPAGQRLDQDRLNFLFVPGGRIAVSLPPRSGRDADVVFLTPGQYALAFDRQNGNGFVDRNDANHVERFGVMAHVYSTYESRNTPADRIPIARGIKSFDLLNSGNQWRIVQVYWDQERPGNPIPEEYMHDRIDPAASVQDSVTAADRTAVQQIIAAQLDAFRHDDATAAFGFAAPRIRAAFGDGPHFLAMVRQAYPLVYRQRSFRFGTSRIDDHGRLVQKLQLVGDNGDEAVALYTMEEEADGSWRIAGCNLVMSRDQEI